MRKTTFYCDRCGKQSADIIQLGHRRIDTESGYELDHEWAAELCPTCYKEIDDTIVHMIWHPEYKAPTQVISKTVKPKDVKKANHKSNIDLGRIAALYNAGWKPKAIADDMHYSEQTIRNHLQEAIEYLEKKKAREDLAEALEKDIQEA